MKYSETNIKNNKWQFFSEKIFRSIPSCLPPPYQGFQYFSHVPVLPYLQAELCLKIRTFFMNILCNTL